MPTFKITLAYDGTAFVGWQRQASGVSIQGLVEDALRELAGSDVTVTGAGRTDAGVHALGQVASFSLERSIGADAVMRALNARLPGAVRVRAAEEAPPEFHARFGARAKTYRYRIWNGDVISPFDRCYAWHVTGRLHIDRMAAAARLFEGSNDYAAFQAAGSSASTTVRTIFSSRISFGPESTTTEDTDTNASPGNPDAATSVDSSQLRDLRGSAFDSALIVFEITGAGFLRHMVRTMAGTLMEIGRGRKPVDWIGDVLASRDRARAGPTAPPGGLFLVSVDYPQ